MSIRRVSSPAVPEPRPGLWSNCLVAGDIAYFSGLTSRAADLVTIGGRDEYEQSRIIFGKIKSLVEAAGGAMTDVVKLTMFVTRIANREQVWSARNEAFSGTFPVCTLVEVTSLAAPSILVEIDGIAHIGASRT